MTTIRDVARYANVSTATVSHYLNGTARVSTEKAARIETAIRALNYIPNNSAQTLRAQKNFLVGIIMPDLNNSYYSQILLGIEDYLRAHGFSSTVSFSKNDISLETELITNYRKMRVAGIILITCQPENSTFFSSLDIPLVLIDRDCHGIRHSFVSFNYKELVQELLEQIPCEFIDTALLIGPKGYSSEDEIYAGFVSIMRAANIHINPFQISRSVTSRESAFSEVLLMCRQYMPKVIITSSSDFAEGIAAALTLIGLKSPDDINIYSFGVDSWQNKHVNDNIHYIGRPGISIGQKAAELLEHQIIGEPPQNYYFNGTIPAQPTKVLTRAHSSAPLHICLPDITIFHNFVCLLPHYEKQNNCRIIPHFVPLNGYLSHAKDFCNNYDIFLFDRPWINQLVENNTLFNLSPYIIDSQYYHSKYLSNCLDSMCRVNNSYFGLPFISIPQLLYYRLDLFSNQQVMNEYEHIYGTKLLPPTNWNDYTKIALFFKNSKNAATFVSSGCGFSAASDDAFSSEFYPYFRSLGGQICDEEYQVCLNSKATRKTFQLLRYAATASSENCFDTDLSREVKDFLQGKSAMISTFRQPLIIPDFPEKIIGSHQIGYTHLPNRSSILGGWCMGVYSGSAHFKDAIAFINWACGEDIASYMTILTGQSTLQSVYDNAELISLYPWLSMLKEVTSYAQPLPLFKDEGRPTVPIIDVNKILYQCFKNIVQYNVPIVTAVENAHTQMKNLFISYGYPQYL